MDLIFFILICYGLTQLIVFSSILNKIRPSKEFLYGFGKLFHCPMCMGFHVGYTIFLTFWFNDFHLWPDIYTGCFLYGCLSSGTSYMLSMLIGDSGWQVSSSKEK